MNNQTTSLTYKIASKSDEFRQIYALNYETFVEEIPQHEQNSERQLIDRFHDENTYIIALDGGVLVGMIAIRGNRPFSLDQKLDHLDDYLPDGFSACEIRLLSVKKSYRHTSVFFGLCETLVSYCLENGYDMALISGTTRQEKLYRHLGFKSFGPLVGTGEAQYQPMYLTKERFDRKTVAFKRVLERQSQTYSLLPGPVNVSKDVRQAMGVEPLSHRSNAFKDELHRTKTALCNYTGAAHAELFVGTGTLGNDVVAGQLSLLQEPGLILVGGEFGERLVDHASRFGLSFEVLKKAWGTPFNQKEIEHFLSNHPEIGWIWTVHCETSTGYVFDAETLMTLSKQYDVKLCLDGSSSIGAIPIDLGQVYLATTVSGKALGSYAGLTIVFYNHNVRPSEQLPRYLDLGLYAKKEGVPFTHSSNLVSSLLTALRERGKQTMNDELQKYARWLREVLVEKGFQLVGDDRQTSPAVITIELPDALSSQSVGDQLFKKGYHVSYQSDYLLMRNWIQLSLMGDHSADKIEGAVAELEHISTLAGGHHHSIIKH
ncbi:aminotransferase class V-fold PLP-dependent enzyme [Tuberibacillus sp. Marseille-P3662]|uniref:aminotransferase class V-fold PLP-dependent enzyme n=1 Tax=Tuberibacillus sp. Marseille-P3662 TaxID=1965358 RepID=UPI000A1CE0B5|nr:aminotransferase class V-fold PLP-dependent enzyme [Tuberibacillus sp. Marseille-P3662]